MSPFPPCADEQTVNSHPNAALPETWKGGTYGTTETLEDGSTLITGFTANQSGVTSAVAYFRVSLNPCKGANLTITVNEEIP